MIVKFLLVLLLITFSSTISSAEEYRRSMTIFVENKSPFPNRVQVQDVELRFELAEDCRIAKKLAALCNGDTKKKLRLHSREKMTCATAIALVEEPRCTYKDLIFDDWIDGGMKVKLTITTNNNGFGTVKVRTVNNTESWTIKPGLRDGDIVGHQ